MKKLNEFKIEFSLDPRHYSEQEKFREIYTVYQKCRIWIGPFRTTDWVYETTFDTFESAKSFCLTYISKSKTFPIYVSEKGVSIPGYPEDVI